MSGFKSYQILSPLFKNCATFSLFFVKSSNFTYFYISIYFYLIFFTIILITFLFFALCQEEFLKFQKESWSQIFLIMTISHKIIRCIHTHLQMQKDQINMPFFLEYKRIKSDIKIKFSYFYIHVLAWIMFSLCFILLSFHKFC